MNELKSYTEYAVSTPTADFVIGFDFNYGEDAVNVTVDDVPATEAGYTVVYLNETTIRLSPSVPSGVVRLQRETDIDQTDHAYRAGAKFIAQTMDENFEQLRHSQQEVRDGFTKLADDTYEIIDTLQEVGQSAQDAADAAEVAAALANNAAAQVNDKVSYTDFNNKPHNAMLGRDAASAHPTSSILDASGETQQQVNYNGGSKWHSRVGGYKENERVVLANGDVVKSTVDGNTNDPNVDMTGWYNPDELQRLLNLEQVSFTTLGIIPNTGADLTLKINQAIITHRNVFVQNGDYVVSSIEIPSNTVITTQGSGVRFIQKAGSGEGTRVIKVVGSNVYVLPAISVKGNIATDPNEQNHAIYIQANATTGHINNVNIGDVYAEDIRGDAVYFGQATGAQYKLTNVTIGNVSFDNVYRNGVSVVSCNGFNIKSVVGKRVGMMDIDIEANISSGVCMNGYIGFVKGKCIGGIAQTQTDFVDNVIFDRVELSYTDYVNSTPEYPSYYKIPVLYRNIKSMTINELIIDGCDGYAISRIDGDAPLANTPLQIGKLTIRNACKVSNAENGIIKGGHVVVDYLDLDFSGLTSRSLCYAGSNYTINKADVNFAASCNLFRSSNNSKISRLATKSTALGAIFNGGTNGVVEDSTANLDRIFGNATKGLMINCNFTAVTPFAGGDNHTAINTDINGSYYANGLTQYGYLNCLRMGVFYIWVSANGFMRIKSTAPTSDTDGTLIGNQGLSTTVTYDPPLLAANAIQSTSVTLTGAAVGNIVSCSLNQPLQGTRLWAEVTATNTVTVYHQNPTASPIDVASGTLIVKLI